jgi:hypothetical protein
MRRYPNFKREGTVAASNAPEKGSNHIPKTRQVGTDRNMMRRGVEGWMSYTLIMNGNCRV